MRAMFRVTLRERGSSMGFTTETVIASDAGDAIRRVEVYARRTYEKVKLFVTDVELVGAVTVATGRR